MTSIQVDAFGLGLPSVDVARVVGRDTLLT